MREDKPFEVSSADLNRRFGEIRRRAASGPVAVTFHGRPDLMISSVAHYRQMADGGPDADMATIWRRVVQLILDHLREGYFSVDSDLVVCTVNRVAELFVGRTREELVGRPLGEAFPAIGGEVDAIERVMNDGQIVRVERNSILHPDRRVAVTMIPLPTPPGGVGILFDNITQEARMQATLAEQETALATLLETIDDRIVFSINARERIDRWGEGAHRRLGWTFSDIQNAPVQSILVEPAAAPLPGRAPRRVALRHKDGSTVIAEGTVRLLGTASPAAYYILRPE